MSQRIYTYEDYCKLNDDRRHEVIDGVIYLMSAPSRQHQELSRELFGQIWNYLRDKPCEVYAAPFDVRLPLAGEEAEKPKNVVQPDIVIVCDESKLDDAGCLGAPDLVVEIISPSSVIMDAIKKRELYEKAGVAEYWLVDPVRQQVTILRLENGRFGAALTLDKEEALTTPLLPELTVDLQQVFRNKA